MNEISVRRMERCLVLPALFFILSAVLASGCVSQGSAWSITINGDASRSVNATLYDRLVNDSQAEGNVTGIPLEIFLYYYGAYPVTSVSFGGTVYDWNAVAEGSSDDAPMLVTANGSLYYDGRTYDAGNVDVSVAEKPGISTLDVAPSILYALDAGPMKNGILPNKTSRVVLVYIDAFGYQRYENASRLGLVDNLSALGEPIKAICVYPSVTQPNAKALVTGRDTDLTKGDFRSYLPDGETVLDILDGQGKKAAWVDGDSAPVHVNGTILNVDRDGDGSADDDATDAAIEQYKAGASLVILHLDDTDAVMHEYGPYTPQGEASVREADALVGKLVSSLDKGTAIVVWADHGCHESEGRGDHGTLIPDDMYVPVFVHYI